jgi:hypothetical protein
VLLTGADSGAGVGELLRLLGARACAARVRGALEVAAAEAAEAVEAAEAERGRSA